MGIKNSGVRRNTAINYLLNVGPDPMGRIPALAQEILRRVGTLG